MINPFPEKDRTNVLDSMAAMSDEYALLAESYDNLYSWRVEDIIFYLEEASSFPGPILEAGCGTGRITLPMAELCPGMHALDSSKAMLRVLERKLQAYPHLSLKIHLGDFRNFRLETAFRQILVPFRGFLHLLDQNAQIGALTNFRHHLASGGRLIMDVFAPSYRILSQEGTSVHVLPEAQLDNGRRLRSSDYIHYDHSRQHILIKRHLQMLDPAGQQEEQITSFTLRYVFRYEMELLLAAAGFSLQEVYGGFDRRPYDYVGGEMIFIARPK